MNTCGECGIDFGSVAAFDRHRVGVHAYSLRDGLKMDPPREDGRRCLSAREIETLHATDGSLIFTRNSKGTWSLTKTLEAAERAFG